MQASQHSPPVTSKFQPSLPQGMAMPSNLPAKVAAGTMTHHHTAPVPALPQHPNASRAPSLPGQPFPHARSTGPNIGATTQAAPYSPTRDPFVRSLSGRTAILIIGPQNAYFTVPVGLLASHSSILLNEISKETTKDLNEKAVQDEDSKKRKLNADDNGAGPEHSGIIRSNENILHFQDMRLPAPVIKLEGLDPAVFNLFLRFIYQGSYPQFHEAPPVAGQVQGEECHSLSIRAWLFGAQIEAYSFLNHTMLHIYRLIAGGTLTITPTLFEFVWVNTKKVFSIDKTLHANTLRTLFLHLLVNHWPHKQSSILYRAGEIDLVWMAIIKRHDDLFQHFIQGIPEKWQVLPVEGYLIRFDQPKPAPATPFKLPQKKASVRKPTAATQAPKDDANASRPPQKEKRDSVVQNLDDNIVAVNLPPKLDPPSKQPAPRSNYPSPKTSPLREALARYDKSKEEVEKPGAIKGEMKVETAMDVDNDASTAHHNPTSKVEKVNTDTPAPHDDPISKAEKVDKEASGPLPPQDTTSTAKRVARISYLREQKDRFTQLDKEKAAIAAKAATATMKNGLSHMSEKTKEEHLVKDTGSKMDVDVN